MHKAVFLVMAIGGFSRIYAQPDSLNPTKPKRVVVLGVPTLGTGPETGFYFGVVGLVDVVPRGDSLARHSVIRAELTYTLKKQFVVATEWLLTPASQRFQIVGSNTWMRFPEMYWGIGGSTKNSNGFLYQTHRLELANGYYRNVGNRWYAGINQRLQTLYNTRFPDLEVSRLGQNIPGREGGTSSGLGLGVLHDTRTNLLRPRAGEVYFSTIAQTFQTWLGSQYRFGSVDVEGRYYLGLGQKTVLAFQGLLQLKTGHVPFRMMSLMGSEFLMRGFYRGRFRDLNQLAAQTEYRFPIWNWLGMTTFASAGNVFNFDNIAQSGRLKYTGGVGIRIRVDKKEQTNMRFDFALNSEGETGFYVSFGEAF